MNGAMVVVYDDDRFDAGPSSASGLSWNIGRRRVGRGAVTPVLAFADLNPCNPHCGVRPVIFSTDHSSNCDITSVRSGHSVNQPSRKLAFPARDSSENQPSIVQARRFKIDVPRLGNENVLEVVPIERRTLVPRPGHVH